jgi:CRP-like cAMP-binding protein
MTKLSANGKDQIVKFTQIGALLGQRSLISDEPANLSAIAVEEMEVCFIPKSEIFGFLNKNYDFSMGVMKMVCGDLKDADEALVDLAQKNVKERFAQTLLYLEENLAF